MKKINSYIFAALAVAGLAGCQAEVLVENVPAEVGTHTVSFIAGQEDTKTSMEISSGVVNFDWTAADADNFTIYENGIEATDNTGVLVGDVMSITAEFANTDATTFRYDAYLNGGVPAEQSCTAVTYDSSADVLVAKTVNATAAETDFTFQFKRVVAISQMTIKGMENGETIESVVISSDKDITGDFTLDPANDFAETWSNEGKTITLTPSSTITVADAKAVVNFVTLPVEGAQLEITVTTDKSTYSKTFASTITFSEGRVKTFGVTVEKERVITFEYADHVGWTVDAVDKSSSSCFVLATGTSIVTPVFSFEQINKIEITQRTYGGASFKTVDVCLGGSTIASITAGSSTLTKYSTETSPVCSTETAAAQLVFKAAKDCSSTSNGPGVSVIKVYYYGSDPILPKSYSVSIDNSIENGSVEVSATSAYEGDEIILSATPEFGYAFESWTVTNVATSEVITVNNDKFEMPASDVVVSATFVADETPTCTINLNNAFWGTSYGASAITGITPDDFTQQGTASGISVEMNNGTSTSGYITDTQTRVYNGYTLAFTAPSGYKITDIAFTAEGTNWTGAHTASSGVMTDNKNWTGSSTSVTITFKGTCRIVSVEVTLAIVGATVSAESVSLDKTALTMSTGEEKTLVATVLPADASNKAVLWTSSNNNVAIVENGKVLAVSAGTSTITATTEDGGFKATCEVTVTLSTYASLAELVAAGAPSTTAVKVNVTITDATIKKIVTNGIMIEAGDKQIEVYCSGLSSLWAVGGTVSATLTNCDWELYGTTWELCPTNWDAFTYTAPSADGPLTLIFDMSKNPGGWPTTNSTTLTDYTYKLNDVTYTFSLKNVKCNSGYLMCTSTAALGLPAIEGKKLTKVVAKNSSGCSTGVFVGISSSGSSGNYVTGGESVNWSTTSSSYTYTLTGTSNNTMYYLYVTTKNGQIVELTLTYE